jgi:hypothetical protein
MEDKKEVMNMTTLTLELPRDLLSLLQERASERGQELQDTALRILQKELAPEVKSEREQVIEALRASGLVRPLSEDLRQMIDPTVTHEDVEAAFARAGGKPLSEIIIEQRRERHERIVS